MVEWRSIDVTELQKWGPRGLLLGFNRASKSNPWATITITIPNLCLFLPPYKYTHNHTRHQISSSSLNHFYVLAVSALTLSNSHSSSILFLSTLFHFDPRIPSIYGLLLVSFYSILLIRLDIRFM